MTCIRGLLSFIKKGWQDRNLSSFLLGIYRIGWKCSCFLMTTELFPFLFKLADTLLCYLLDVFTVRSCALYG